MKVQGADENLSATKDTLSVQQTLPKLQFVVKYARRSRHESTIRYRNMNLQGSKTHIMPLNLVQ